MPAALFMEPEEPRPGGEPPQERGHDLRVFRRSARELAPKERVLCEAGRVRGGLLTGCRMPVAGNGARAHATTEPAEPSGGGGMRSDEMDSSRDPCGIIVPGRICPEDKEESVMKTTVFAVDISKAVFEVAVSHHPGRVSKQRRLSRLQFLHFMGQQPPGTVLMESCGSAHYWARRLQESGHEVRLLPARDVALYRRGNKTDRADAKALLEAGRNEEIHPVPVKSIEQQTVTALHRLRSRWLATRTARLNTMRGVLRELGLFIPLGASKVVPQVRAWLEDEAEPLAPSLRVVLREACDEIGELEHRIRLVQVQLRALGKGMEAVARLQTIPGVGLLTATAMVGFVGNAERFPSGRHFASYLGLTPREHSSGLVRRVGRISKRGDVYLRMLLIHGARTVLWGAKRREHPDRLRSWAQELQQRRGHNKATAALANRLARIIWAVWVRSEEFREVARSKEEEAQGILTHPEAA
jgi:transposase